MKHFLKAISFIAIITALIIPRIATAADESAKANDENKIAGLVGAYSSFVDKPISEKVYKTPQEAFNSISEFVKGIRVYHKHITSSSNFGFSFTSKNAPPLDYVFNLLTGRIKQWPRDVIEGGKVEIKIADVGCGLGLSAVYLISKVVQYYEDNKWTLAKPITLDLFDVNSEHQPALTALSELVNLAHPKFFAVKSYVYDVTESPQFKSQYRILFSLNVMHYIPLSKWSTALTNMRDMMINGGMQFLTTDHYKNFIDLSTSAAETMINNAEFQFLIQCCQKLTENNKFLSHFAVYDPRYPLEKGTTVINYDAKPFLANDEEYSPGKVYKQNDINADALCEILEIQHKNKLQISNSVLKSLGVKPLKDPANISMWNGTTMERVELEEWKRRFKAGEILINSGNYVFDNTTLEFAIKKYLPGCKVGKYNWNDADKKGSAGITLLKQST